MSRWTEAGTAYRGWYAAAGAWAGYFRAVPLVAYAQGQLRPDRVAAAEAHTTAQVLAAHLVRRGQAECWLGQPNVLLVLDLPGASAIHVTQALGAHGVQPVLLLFQWPGPRALVPAAGVLAALLAGRPPPWADAPQPALVLDSARTAPAQAPESTTRFYNRYELGTVDLPAPARLAAAGIDSLVTCQLLGTSPARDLLAYQDQLRPTLRAVHAVELPSIWPTEV